MREAIGQTDHGVGLFCFSFSLRVFSSAGRLCVDSVSWTAIFTSVCLFCLPVWLGMWPGLAAKLELCAKCVSRCMQCRS